MQKLIANTNRVLSYVVTPTTVTCAPVETNTPALHTQAGGSPVLLDKIHIECTFAGTAADGGVYAGKSSGDITASTPKVQVEGKSVIVQGDEVTITCSDGTSTLPSSSPVTTPASVKVTVTSAGQLNVFANHP